MDSGMGKKQKEEVRKMKCDDCENKAFHAGGGFLQVAEGGDDPYDYWYCKAGHWCDDPYNYEKFNKDIIDGKEIDPWINCKDFEKELKK